MKNKKKFNTLSSEFKKKKKIHEETKQSNKNVKEIVDYFGKFVRISPTKFDKIKQRDYMLNDFKIIQKKHSKEEMKRIIKYSIECYGAYEYNFREIRFISKFRYSKWYHKLMRNSSLFLRVIDIMRLRIIKNESELKSLSKPYLDVKFSTEYGSAPSKYTEVKKMMNVSRLRLSKREKAIYFMLGIGGYTSHFEKYIKFKRKYKLPKDISEEIEYAFEEEFSYELVMQLDALIYSYPRVKNKNKIFKKLHLIRRSNTKNESLLEAAKEVYKLGNF